MRYGDQRTDRKTTTAASAWTQDATLGPAFVHSIVFLCVVGGSARRFPCKVRRAGCGCAVFILVTHATYPSGPSPTRRALLTYPLLARAFYDPSGPTITWRGPPHHSLVLIYGPSGPSPKYRSPSLCLSVLVPSRAVRTSVSINTHRCPSSLCLRRWPCSHYSGQCPCLQCLRQRPYLAVASVSALAVPTVSLVAVLVLYDHFVVLMLLSLLAVPTSVNIWPHGCPYSQCLRRPGFARSVRVGVLTCSARVGVRILRAAFAPPPPLLHRRRAVCLCSTCRRAAVSAAAVCLCSTAAAALLPSLLHRPLCSTAAALLHRRRAARCCCLGPWTSAPPAWLPWKHAVPKE